MAIGGPGDVEPQVNAGIAAQPLVTPADTSVVGSAAVQNLVNSFRNGTIGAQDVIDRIGPLAQAKKRALMEELSEYVSPESIASRKAQVQANTIQANLASQQAGAGIQNLPSSSYAQRQQNLLAGYNPDDQESIHAFGAFHSVPKTDSGDYDYDSILDQGVKYKGAFNMLAMARKGLAMGTPIPYEFPNGQKGVIMSNGFGEPRDADTIQRYTEMYNEAYREAYDIDQQEAKAKGQPAPKPTIAPSPMAAAAAGAPAPLVSPAAGGPVTVQTPNHTVTIAPNSAPPIQGVPAGAVAMGAAPGTTAPEVQQRTQSLRTALEAAPRVNNWDKAQTFVQPFKQTAEEVAKMTPAEQQSADMALKDQGLIENLIKLYDPQGVMREFKWEKLEQQQDLVEKWLDATNVTQRLRGRTVLTPGARRKLIDLGYHTINGMENAAADVLQMGDNLAKNTGLSGPVLDAAQQDLVNGKRSQNPFGASASGAAAPATAAAPSNYPPGTTARMLGGKPIWLAPDGTYWQR